MNNFTRQICGVENGTTYFDVLEHEYNSKTSQCVPLAVRASITLKVVSYLICALASLCASSILIMSILLFPELLSKIRKRNHIHRSENRNVIWLQCCFCVFGFMGSVMMVVPSARGISFVIPLHTLDGALNTLAFFGGNLFNTIAVTSYPLTFKEIRISTMVVPLVTVPPVRRTMGLLFLNILVIFTLVAVSLATGWITDPFNLNRLVYAWATPLVILLGLTVPDMMLPMLKSLDDILSKMDENGKADMCPKSNNNILKAKSLGIIRQGTQGNKSKLSFSTVPGGKPNIDKKTVAHARLTIWRLRRWFQVGCVIAPILTIVLIYTPLAYNPNVTLLFQLYYNGAQLLLLFAIEFPMYRNMRPKRSGRVSQIRNTTELESTVIRMSGTQFHRNFSQMSIVDRPNQSQACVTNEDVY